MSDVGSLDELPAAAFVASDAVYDAICDRGNLTRRQLLTWAGDRLAPGLPVFVEGGLFHIRGRLDTGRFQRAFGAVLEECDALQMVFEDVDGWPQQRRLPPTASTIEMVDLSAARTPRVALEELARERMETALGTAGHLLGAALVRMQPEHHVWVLAQHQLISDAWSFRLVHRRMVDHYQREQHGCGEADIPPPFHEYITYERNYRASPQHRRARAYWQSRMSRLPVRPAAVHSRGVGGATRICRVSHRLGRDTTAALRRLAGTQSASPDMGLFIVFASLMAAHVCRTTGTQDVILSVPFANRPSRRFKDTVGSFMNVCPIRVAVERGDTFLTLLGRVEHETWEAARYQGCVVPQVAGVQPYDVLVNVHKEAVADRAFAEFPMDVEWLAPTHRFGAFSLGVQNFNATSDLILALDFNEETFGNATREDMTRSILGLLDGCLVDPARALDRVDVASVERIPDGASGGWRKTPAIDGPPVSGPPDVARTVSVIWCDLLRRNTIGVHDDFFELGGDSLLAYHMLVRVGTELFVELSAELFFESPTVASVTAAVETARARGVSTGELGDVVREIGGISDEEVAMLLGEEASNGRHSRSGDG